MKKYSILSMILVLLSSCFVGCSSNRSGAVNEYDAMSMEKSADFGMVAGNPAMEETAAAPSPSFDAPAGVVEDQRKLVKTVSLNLEVLDIEQYVSKLEAQVNALGGYIENMTMNSSSYRSHYGEDLKTSLSEGEKNPYTNADITVRIPSSLLDNFLESAKEGVNITYHNENVSDITLQYSDTQSHIDALDVEQERLLELIANAESVDAIIALETRLSEIRYELNSYNSQIKIFDNQVDYATVVFSISLVRSFSTTQKDGILARIGKGFMRNLKGVGHSLTELVIALIINLPSILLVILILFGLYRLIQYLTRKRGIRGNRREKGSSHKTKSFFHNHRDTTRPVSKPYAGQNDFSQEDEITEDHLSEEEPAIQNEPNKRKIQFSTDSLDWEDAASDPVIQESETSESMEHGSSGNEERIFSDDADTSAHSKEISAENSELTSDQSDRDA